MLCAYELAGPVPEPRRELLILALGRYQAVGEAVRVGRRLRARLGGEVGAARDVVVLRGRSQADPGNREEFLLAAEEAFGRRVWGRDTERQAWLKQQSSMEESQAEAPPMWTTAEQEATLYGGKS